MVSCLEMVWSRGDKPSRRERSIVTVTALITKRISDNSLNHHLTDARSNSITAEEMAEV